MIFLVLGTGSSYNMEMQQFFSNEFLICTEIYRYNTRGGGGDSLVQLIGRLFERVRPSSHRFQMSRLSI